VYTGDIGFSFTVLNSDFSVAGQGTADGTLTITLTRTDSNSAWRLASAQASIRQHSPVTFHNYAFGETIQVDMTGTYSLVAGEWELGGNAQSLNGDTLVFKMLGTPGTSHGGGFNLIVGGQFSNGRFLGSVVNPGQETRYVTGANLDEGTGNYLTQALVKWNVGTPRVNGVNLIQS